MMDASSIDHALTYMIIQWELGTDKNLVRHVLLLSAFLPFVLFSIHAALPPSHPRSHSEHRALDISPAFSTLAPPIC